MLNDTMNSGIKEGKDNSKNADKTIRSTQSSPQKIDTKTSKLDDWNYHDRFYSPPPVIKQEFIIKEYIGTPMQESETCLIEKQIPPHPTTTAAECDNNQEKDSSKKRQQHNKNNKNNKNTKNNLNKILIGGIVGIGAFLGFSALSSDLPDIQ
jgi:hypothetical protein